MPSFRHSRSRALAIALALALLGLGVPANAAPAPANLADAQSQASAARAKLDSMRTSLASGMSAYASAASDLSRTRAQIASNKRDLAKVQASITSGQKSLGTQADFMYRTDGAGFVDVLLGSSTFEQFAARLSILQQIASKDAVLVDSLKHDREQARVILAGLSAREARQVALVSKVAAQRDSVQSSIDQQQAFYNSLSTQVASLVAQQEQAAKSVASNSSPSTPDPGSGSVPKPKKAPPASGKSVPLKQATVTGRSGKYWVMASDSSSFSPTGVKFSGGASVYSVSDNGTGTSSGRPLNDHELTCAHRTLPFGTRIAVTHGGSRIIVVVTDRGPYVSGRVLDLTPRGASLLGIDGVGDVKCEVVEGN